MKLIMIVATAVLALTVTAQAAGTQRSSTAHTGNSIPGKTFYSGR
ncbi:hypothetical protein N8A98_12465 [Devosia neptuniae]|jgi:hypothetical protein|uniref:Uncharacterized protein n=1 Tax=Devosia neptuniae TaxID=191302 RepID=A0ABY6CIE3_9HYPH|nr:hypothetical protein [Devosia neptuniae]UXN71935.1 hypothetical protein N8A98_12465 [Devosia neptuniae]